MFLGTWLRQALEELEAMGESVKSSADMQVSHVTRMNQS